MMRYSHYIILLLASIFYFSTVLANDRVVDYKKLQNRNGVFYEMNTQVPFSGVSVLSSYESGQWRYITRYDTGKKIAFEMYFENGQLSFQRIFDDDKEKSISYHFNGIVKSKASYKDSNPFGGLIKTD